MSKSLLNWYICVIFRDLALHLCICVFILLSFRIRNKIDAEPYRRNSLTELLRNCTVGCAVYHFGKEGEIRAYEDRRSLSSVGGKYCQAEYFKEMVALPTLPTSGVECPYCRSATPLHQTRSGLGRTVNPWYRFLIEHFVYTQLIKNKIMKFRFHQNLENFWTAERLSGSHIGL
jgi:hypothetical protein